jgi:hypothetical protein
MRKTFNLDTIIGRLTFQVVSANQIYVQTPDERSPEGRVISPVVIRGKEHTGNMHFTLLPNGNWEALTWDGSGNHLIPVDPTSDWSIHRATTLRPVGGFTGDSTDAAKRKFYEVVKEELNNFARLPKNGTEILDEMKLRAVEYREAKIETLQAKVEKLRNDLSSAEAELATLTK